ncbi:MAG: DNA mismatch repair protein MutS [Candidatus Omnitrophica bacterium]|nr:DNA mismatch repair protein MutS [Candidatus Omnitrophota bacterium]
MPSAQRFHPCRDGTGTPQGRGDPMLTPMMEQYRSIKKTLSGDTVLFFRLGDFYEMFFEDAVRASEILNITLTGREGGSAGRVPMCGVPYHSFQPYVRALLDRNLKVAICEQIGDPRAAKGLVERKVTRIITPATFLDEETQRVRPEYLVAVVAAVGRALYAIAALDLGTGEFSVREVVPDRLGHTLALLGPRELILPRSLAEGELSQASFPKEGPRASVTVYEDWVFEPQEALRLLKERFQWVSDRSVSFHDHPLAVGASGAILYYLKDHLHASLGHLAPPAFVEAHEFMALDRQAVKSLELVAGGDGMDRGGSLLGVIDSTWTPMGGRTLYQWITQPLLSLPEIQNRQEAVAEIAADLPFVQTVCSLFKGIKDVERILGRLNVGVANARDLLHLKFFLERTPQIQAVLNQSKSHLLQTLRADLKPFPELTDRIARAMVDQPPLTLKEGNLIRSGYSKELDDLKGLAAQGRSWLVEFQRRESQRTGIKSLRIKYSQVFGYAMEVSKPNLHLVPPDYLRKQTLVNAERFITPELKSWDERIAGAEEKIKALEYQLFQEIREQVLQEISPLQRMAKGLGVLDALVSLGAAAIQRNWVRPTLTDSRELRIQGGRHPVVERMLPAGQFVENDTLLDGRENQIILLTGPNMAGKSTYIRQVAQIVLLAQIGSFVPARSAVIGLVDRIFTRIGASDDLARGESTFMVEMVEMAQILQMATDRSLLILDEVGRGTSTFDGVSLAWAIGEYLAQGTVRPRSLFATHYHELIQLEQQFPSVKNYTVSVRETPEGVVFLRRVVRGGSDKSYGIHVARLAGLPEPVTERAAQILKILESEKSQATLRIEGEEAKETKEEEPAHPILEEIRDLDLEGLTPLQALNKLAEWSQKLRSELNLGRSLNRWV